MILSDGSRGERGGNDSLSLNPVDVTYLYYFTVGLCTPFPPYKWYGYALHGPVGPSQH
jgi:hypothetical protein